MLLAIDVGNTNTVFALFELPRLLCAPDTRFALEALNRDYGDATPLVVWRSLTQAQRTSDEYAVFLHSLMRDQQIDPRAIKAVIIGSVVPEANFNVTKLCREHFACEPLMVGTPQVETGIKILIDRPDEIGADRIINAVGGALAYKPPLLIIDFGTATTFDVVNAEGDYVGGVIAPGINLSLQALHMAAAKLPKIGIAPTQKVIARNTQDAIRSGVYWGYAGLIEGLISRIKTEFGVPMTVVATGGLAPMFAPVVKAIDHLDEHVTLRGLAEIYCRSTKKSGH